MFSLKYCIVHHKTHQAPLLCLPVKFYPCFKLSIILFENDIYDVRPKKIFGVGGGGWWIWVGMGRGREGGYCLPLFTVLHVFYLEKSLTQVTLYTF